MIGTLLTLAVCLTLFMISRWWWRSHLNPVSLGILAWTPALIMLNFPPYFLSPHYIHLNRAISFNVYLAMGLSFAFFWAGCALVKAISKRNDFDLNPRMELSLNVPRAVLLFSVGLAIFLYGYFHSGLLDLQNLDARQVVEARLNLHLGPVSLLGLFMDIVAIGMFARMLQTQRWIYGILPLIAILCQAATLQKSTFMFLVIAYSFVAALHPRATYRLLWKPLPARIGVIIAVITVGGTLLAMNQARGIAVVPMTAAASPVFEQVYIYSGATAIMNVSVTVDGYMPTDPPAMGLYLLRPITWHLVDRDMLFATRYFEGINAATYMIYGWADFWWLGFVITPFITGVAVMLFIRSALRGSIAGLMLGALAAKAVMLSPSTDVMFDPTTLVQFVAAWAAHLFTRIDSPAARSAVLAAAARTTRRSAPGPQPLTPRA